MTRPSEDPQIKRLVADFIKTQSRIDQFRPKLSVILDRATYVSLARRLGQEDQLRQDSESVSATIAESFPQLRVIGEWRRSKPEYWYGDPKDWERLEFIRGVASDELPGGPGWLMQDAWYHRVSDSDAPKLRDLLMSWSRAHPEYEVVATSKLRLQGCCGPAIPVLTGIAWVLWEIVR